MIKEDGFDSCVAVMVIIVVFGLVFPLLVLMVSAKIFNNIYADLFWFLLYSALVLVVTYDFARKGQGQL